MKNFDRAFNKVLKLRQRPWKLFFLPNKLTNENLKTKENVFRPIFQFSAKENKQ